jgi:hypothetical protein
MPDSPTARIAVFHLPSVDLPEARLASPRCARCTALQLACRSLGEGLSYCIVAHEHGNAASR